MSDTAPPPASRAPWLGRFELAILTVLGVAATLIMFANAVLRYVLGSSLIWAEETIRILFVWAMFVAITASFFRDEHIGYDALAKRPGIPRGVYRAVYALCLVLVGGILAWHGYRYTTMTGDVELPATTLPTSILMWPGVVAGAVWFALGVWRLLGLVRDLAKGRTP